MTPSESVYGRIAVLAAKKAAVGLDARAAWETTAAALAQSPTVANKSCPKGAFLGLIYAGEVAGVPGDSSKISGVNGGHACAAVGLLRGTSLLGTDPAAVWQAVMKLEGTQKKHNSQMHVVLALWNERMFVGQSA